MHFYFIDNTGTNYKQTIT